MSAASAAAASSGEGGIFSSLLSHHCSGVCPHDSCLLSIIRGFRHGLWYGAKIRFPHALVMTFLFRSGSFSDKFRDIFRATWQHSRNLALYVSLYKAICCLVRHARGKESPINSLIGGAIGGAIVFGAHTPSVVFFLKHRHFFAHEIRRERERERGETGGCLCVCVCGHSSGRARSCSDR